MALLRAGGLYIVITTEAHVKGEVRGQLGPHQTVVGFHAMLNGAAEVPPVDTTSTGEFTSTLQSDGETLMYELTVAGLAGATAAHIHRALPGANGPPDYWLYDVTGVYGPGGVLDETHPVTGTVTVSAEVLADLVAGLGYVNVHTEAHVDGEIRGQLELADQPDPTPTPTDTGGTEPPPSETPTASPTPSATAVPATRLIFQADLSGRAEVPPVEGAAAAKAHMVLDRTEAEIHYRIDVAALENITAAHVHLGHPGVNGPPVVWLYDATGVEAPGGPVDASHPISGTVAVNATLADAMLAGSAYVNIHTADHPGGAVRGQVETYSGTTAFAVDMRGDLEVPPVDTTAEGRALVSLAADFESLQCLINVSDLADIGAAHIHRGAIGVNGPPVVWLYDAAGAQGPGGPFDPENPLAVTVEVTAQTVLEVLTGGTYINIHTAAHADGEIRGQIGQSPMPVPPVATRLAGTLRAALSGAAEVPPVTTAAEGRAVFVLSERLDADEPSGEYFLTLRLDVAGLELISAAHLHTGGPSVNGPPVLWLFDATGASAPGGAFGPGAPLRRTVAIPGELVADLLAGNVYINVHTLKHPDGEIRGQVEVFVPPTEIRVRLAGAHEVPPGDTDAEGLVVIRLRLETRAELDYELSAHGLVAPMAAHLHRGRVGQNGPVVSWLYDATGVAAPGGDLDGTEPVSDTIALTDADLADVLDEATYVNVHTPAHADGEIRGQVVMATIEPEFDLSLPYIEGVAGAQTAGRTNSPSGIGLKGETGIQIQNLSATDPASAIARFFTPMGVLAATMPAVIEPEAATNIYVPGTSLPAGRYSGHVRADQPIGAIVRTDWPATGGAAIYGDVEAGLDVALPLVVRRYQGQTSRITVQNASDALAEVNVVIQEAGRPTPILTRTLSIEARGSLYFDLETEMPTLGERFIGAFRASSDQPIAVQTFIDVATSEKAVYAFEGVPVADAAVTLYAPLFRAIQYPRGGDPTSGRLDTGISVSNPGSETVSATITYHGSRDRAASEACRGRAFDSPTIAIAPGSSHVFYQGDPATQGLPLDCFGSAVINATGPVLAIVNDSLNEGVTAAGYKAVASGATRVALPLYRREHVGLSTGIQAMNVGSAPANVTISFVRQNGDGSTTPVTGCGDWCTVVVQPGEAHTWWPPNEPALAPGSYGAAVIQSTQPLAVIVNDAEIAGVRDMATYNGLGIRQ